MIQKRPWRGRTEWNWMAGGSAWTIPSLRGPTPPPRASTWGDPPIVEEVAVAEVAEVVEEAGDVVTLTMIVDMIEDMTDMKNMITGTEEDHLLRITVGIDHGQDLVPIAQDATEELNGCY